MILSYIAMTVLMITGIFMIIIILLQRGRGGGLAGAFGGLGGQSAFGTKAGDVFTKVTVGLAVFWVVLAGLSGLALERDANRRYEPDPGETSASPTGVDLTPADDTDKPAENPLDPGINDAENPFSTDKAPVKTTPSEPSSDKSGATPDQPGAEVKSPSKTDKGAPKTAPEEKKPAGDDDAAKTTEKPAEK